MHLLFVILTLLFEYIIFSAIKTLYVLTALPFEDLIIRMIINIVFLTFNISDIKLLPKRG